MLSTSLRWPPSPWNTSTHVFVFRFHSRSDSSWGGRHTHQMLHRTMDGGRRGCKVPGVHCAHLAGGQEQVGLHGVDLAVVNCVAVARKRLRGVPGACTRRSFHTGGWGQCGVLVRRCGGRAARGRLGPGWCRSRGHGRSAPQPAAAPRRWRRPGSRCMCRKTPRPTNRGAG